MTVAPAFEPFYEVFDLGQVPGVPNPLAFPFSGRSPASPVPVHRLRSPSLSFALAVPPPFGLAIPDALEELAGILRALFLGRRLILARTVAL